MSNRFMLVDGLSVAYRVFFGIRELSAPDGAPTNAIYGFVRLIRQLLIHWAPTHCLVAFDGGIPQARRDLLESYKAQRPPMPDLLKQQLPGIHDYLELEGLCWIRREHEEADDLLASAAVWGAGQGADVQIVTSDKDFLQLVNDRIVVVPATGKGDVRMDRDAVRGKYGIEPEQMVDWLALTGDSADNIPGVPGIGPKTATRLLQACGSLEAMWANPERIPGERFRALVLEHRECIERNLGLVRLGLEHAPVCDWREVERKAPQVEGLYRLFERLGFQSLMGELVRGPKIPVMVQGSLF